MISITEFKIILMEADRIMKLSKGHEFQTILKTRCVHCGRSPKVKTKCGAWFSTFVHHLEAIMIKRGYIEIPDEAEGGEVMTRSNSVQALITYKQPQDYPA